MFQVYLLTIAKYYDLDLFIMVYKKHTDKLSLPPFEKTCFDSNVMHLSKIVAVPQVVQKLYNKQKTTHLE